VLFRSNIRKVIVKELVETKMSKKMQAVEPSERSKISQLQKESSDKNNKVEWIYSGDKLDRDAYLLGKPIDKLLIEKEIDKPKEDFFSNTVDLANKIREDPLFEIKKKEIEAKKRLLENPMRIKQIKAMISKRNNQHDSDEEPRHDRNSNHNRRERHRSPSTSDDDRHKKQKYKRKSSASRSRSRSKDNRDKRTRSQERTQDSKYGLNHRDNRDRENSRIEPRSSKQQEIEDLKRQIDKIKQIRQAEKAPANKNITKKLSEEEKQKRLQEMQENAKWRNEVRTTNVKKYKYEAKYEEKLEEASNTKGSQAEASRYFNNMMKDAYTSAEDRIKRNIKNVQRNQSAFEKNFARK